jgi:hypothetical protein
MSSDFEEELLFDDLEIDEERSSRPKEIIINKVYQPHHLNINNMRGEYIINPILDDKNKTIKKYTTSTLVVYDDENLKHFKDKSAFMEEQDEYLRTKFVHQFSEYSKYIKEEKIKPVRFMLPSKDSYNTSLLKDGKSFINQEHNDLHNKLSSNIRTLWTECDVFSQYFNNVINSYFYGKIYRYKNLDGEITIENSKIVLFEVRGKALPNEWSQRVRELKLSFKDLDTNDIDTKSYLEYNKELFNRKLNTPKSKLIELYFAKVSETHGSSKVNKKDNECKITHRTLKNPPKQESGTLIESDFMYEVRENINGEWVARPERMNIDLSQIITLDSVYDEESKRFNNIKFDNTRFDSDWYKLKIAESDRIINKYKSNSSNTNIDDVI